MKDKIEYPEHLSEDILNAMLFIHNAPDTNEAQHRVMFIQKELGNKKASYVMALLMLPFLMDIVERSEEYKEYFDKHKKKTLN